MATAAAPIQVALATAITALGLSVHSMIAPEGTTLPHVIIGDGSEEKFNNFQRKGNSGSVQLSVYARTRLAALTIFGQMEQFFDTTPLTVTNHSYVQGALRLIAIFADEDGKSVHLVSRFEVETQSDG